MSNDVPNEQQSDEPEHVARLLIKHRSTLLAFIVAAMRDFDAAEDVLQEVSIVIWENADQFQPGSNFGAWARSIARRRIAAYWRSRSRSEQPLSEEHLDQLVKGFDQLPSHVEPEVRTRALLDCLYSLKPFISKLIHLRYAKQLSLSEVAEAVGQQTETVRKSLYRGRTALRECIDRRLALEADLGELS